mgnify:CR=1 FL=1
MIVHLLVPCEQIWSATTSFDSSMARWLDSWRLIDPSYIVRHMKLYGSIGLLTLRLLGDSINTMSQQHMNSTLLELASDRERHLAVLDDARVGREQGASTL